MDTETGTYVDEKEEIDDIETEDDDAHTDCPLLEPMDGGLCNRPRGSKRKFDCTDEPDNSNPGDDAQDATTVPSRQEMHSSCSKNKKRKLEAEKVRIESRVVDIIRSARTKEFFHVRILAAQEYTANVIVDFIKRVSDIWCQVELYDGENTNYGRVVLSWGERPLVEGLPDEREVVARALYDKYDEFRAKFTDVLRNDMNEVRRKFGVPEKPIADESSERRDCREKVVYVRAGMDGHVHGLEELYEL